MVIFEVRVPTYNRPELLRRALESLKAQTYPHWVAIVYDDSSSGEGEVAAVADDRIRYRRNSQRLGASANIDQCFSPASKYGGHYGCVLEDDNFWMPGYLARTAQEIERRAWPLIQANQRIWSQARGLHPENETTRGLWFSHGTVHQADLRAALLFAEGLSNGGMIWKLDGPCNFQVGPRLQHFGLQEVCRGLLVQSPFLFIEEALSVYNFMPRENTARGTEDNRSFGRGLQSIRRFIIQQSGTAVIEAALNLAEQRGLRGRIFEILIHSGYPYLIGDRNLMLNWFTLKSMLKGAAINLTQADPCAKFLEDLRRTQSQARRRYRNRPGVETLIGDNLHSEGYTPTELSNS